jgi:hypothetical protein
VAVATAMETAVAGAATTAAGVSTTALGVGADFLFRPQTSLFVQISQSKMEKI